MILYFADRHLNIIGQASTHLPKGVKLISDKKNEEVETGVSTFECEIAFDKKTRSKVEAWAEVGNYILRSSEDENEFFNILEVEIDTKEQTVYIYAEDDGLDLINEVVGSYTADQFHPISYYVERYASGSGWDIGINEVEGLTRKLSFDSEETAMSRLLSIAEAFNNCEISFSFEIRGLQIAKKYINIYEKRGKDTGIQLRLNKEIDSIITSKSISNLATALQATGGTLENDDEPVTLKGYEYDDGDFYVDGGVLKSRKSLEKWSRFLWRSDESQQFGGHIVKQFSYDTTSQAVLCEKTIEELKKVCDMEVNYEADILKLPERVKVGDWVNIIDDAGELYLSSRVLVLETSIIDQKRKATLGEHIIRKSGISQKVEKLASDFAKYAYSTSQAKKIADEAKKAAETANTQAQGALESAQEAQGKAEEAKQAAETAEQSANQAETKANEAKQAVDGVKESVDGMEQSIADAEAAAEQARQAAETAQTKAEEAHTASVNAGQQAQVAEQKANEATEKANEAIEKGNTAQSTAEKAQQKAVDASTTAEAAKKDAEQAQKDIDAFGANLSTVEETMKADYARKTDLTESEAHLQAQITKNASKIASNVSKIQTIDETANDAYETMLEAQALAKQAQEEADEAQRVADEAQATADEAMDAAEAAQKEANKATQAATTAQQVAEQAEADLVKAEEDLATIQGRADATEEEIVEAQAKVDEAQAVAAQAQADAQIAVQVATEAQAVATQAVADAEEAQALANSAASQAKAAQQIADNAEGTAQALLIESAGLIAISAKNAQKTAEEALEYAVQAQNEANIAQAKATQATETANQAQAEMSQAETTLAQAQQRLEAVLAKVGATQEEIEAAQADVETAQKAAQEASEYAEEAQALANKATTYAEEAQEEATLAQQAATEAQEQATLAQQMADKAKADVNSLAITITESETKAEQTSEQILLMATKKEVEKTSNGLQEKIEEQTTQAILEADKLLVTALESYVKSDDYGTFQETVQMQLEALAERLTLTFTQAQEATDAVNADLQNKYNEITTYFTFDIDGLIIGKTENPYKMVLSNERYSMQVDEKEVMYIDAVTKMAYFPQLTITESFEVIGYKWEKGDVDGIVDIDWIGGA